MKNEKFYFMIGEENNTPTIEITNKMGYNIVVDTHDSYINEIIHRYDFTISWGDEIRTAQRTPLEDIDILPLTRQDNIIDRDLNILQWGVINDFTLDIVRNGEKFSSKIKINGEKACVLTENLLRVGNQLFYLKSNKLYTPSELVGDMDISYLENFLTLTRKYFPNIIINYMDYEIVNGQKLTPAPTLIIEKISFDSSLYIKLSHTVNDIKCDFLVKNDIDEIVMIDDEKKKIIISEVDTSVVHKSTEEITKVLYKNQRENNIKNSFYIDESNLIIIQEKLAREFILNDLLTLSGKYKIIGTTKLKKYNIKMSKPKLSGNFTHSIDYLEGEFDIDIEGEKFSLLDILSHYEKNSYITLGSGDNVLIDKKYIDRLERIFKDRESKKVKISFFDMPIVEELINDKIINTSFSKRKDFFKGINSVHKNKLVMPKINAKLREYQKYGYKWLKYLIDNNMGACLADDMGLGKTLQAIVLLTYIHQNSFDDSLVVMPKSLIYNWEKEIKKFNPNLPVAVYYGTARDTRVFGKGRVILTTYGTIRNDIQYLRKLNFASIILDESQNIKNINAQITKAVMLLRGKFRVALSGTPIENNLSELYSLFRFLNPKMFGSYEEFNNFYVIPITRENDELALTELRKKVYPFILRRVKKDVLQDLPEKIEKTIYIDMNDTQKRLYEERRRYFYDKVHNRIDDNGLARSRFYILQAINELRQITSCPEMNDANVISSKREILIDNIEEATENGHKVLVFTNYLSSIENIAKDLDEKNIKYLTMSGATKNRQELVDLFQNDESYKVFIMTLKTGGVGLNLTASDTIFIYDPWWNKTVENQAIDRAYRLGQDKTVFSYKLILRNTIEEKILKLQDSKIKLLDSLITEDSASLKKLSEKDIDFILGE